MQLLFNGVRAAIAISITLLIGWGFVLALAYAKGVL